MFSILNFQSNLTGNNSIGLASLLRVLTTPFSINLVNKDAVRRLTVPLTLPATASILPCNPLILCQEILIEAQQLHRPRCPKT